MVTKEELVPESRPAEFRERNFLSQARCQQKPKPMTQPSNPLMERSKMGLDYFIVRSLGQNGVTINAALKKTYRWGPFHLTVTRRNAPNPSKRKGLVHFLFLPLGLFCPRNRSIFRHLKEKRCTIVVHHRAIEHGLPSI